MDRDQTGDDGVDRGFLVVLCTCPTRGTAEIIARTVVGEGLAACVNILAGLTSVYRWAGEIQSEEEVLVLIKTDKACYEALEPRIAALHPYEVPELIALPVERGAATYLRWLETSLEHPA